MSKITMLSISDFQDDNKHFWGMAFLGILLGVALALL